MLAMLCICECHKSVYMRAICCVFLNIVLCIKLVMCVAVFVCDVRASAYASRGTVLNFIALADNDIPLLSVSICGGLTAAASNSTFSFLFIERIKFSRRDK